MSIVTTLTRREETFAQTWAQTRNVVRAYRIAWEIGPEVTDNKVRARAKAVFAREDVRHRIEEIVNASAENVVLTQANALHYFLSIAFADPSELTNVEIGACRRCYGEGHKHQWRQFEYEEALEAATKSGDALPEWLGGMGYDATQAPNPDCPACHGRGVSTVTMADTRNLSPGAKLLFSGVKQTRNGVEILLADRQAAFVNACRIAGLFQDAQNGGARSAGVIELDQLQQKAPDQLARLYQDMMAGKLTVASK